MARKRTGRRMKSSPLVTPVTIVKRRRKRRGPKVTKLLKNKTTAHLRYVDTVSVDAGSAAIASHVYSANGLFDPDVTGTGHQPLMYDEYKLLYGMYRVISSKIKVTPVPTSNTSSVPALYGVFTEFDATLGYSLGTSIIEDQRNKGSWGLFSSTTGDRNPHMRQSKRASFNAKRMLSPEGADNATAVSTNTATAGFDAFYQIWASSIAGNDPGNVTFIVQIDYIVEFTEPVLVTPS